MDREHATAYYRRFLESLDERQLARYVACHRDLRAGYLRLAEIFVCPSHDCNANCVHCYEKFQHRKLGRSLSTAQVVDVLDQFHALGGYQVFYCSGELLLRPDALELVRQARQRDLAVNLTTNGLLLSPTSIDALIDAGLTRLIVSIDSADPRTHDELRGVPGCFARATDGLALARERGLMTEIWTYVSRSNPDQLAGIAQLGERLDVDSVFVYFPLLSGHLFDQFDENLSREERERYRAEFNDSPKVFLEFASEDTACRGGGASHLAVLPSGDVTFCPPVPYSYGNIADRTLEECLERMREDYERLAHCCRGQCPVNSLEYRERTVARFLYRS